MPYTNIKELLVDATKFPAAVEAKLPAGAPKISTMLVDAAGKIPANVPNFPMEIPDLPAPPELPAGEGFPGLTRYVKEVKVVPGEKERPPVIIQGVTRARPRFLY